MENKHFLLLVVFALFIVPARTQNKIGDNPAVIQPGSLLELESLSKGLRLPRIMLNDINVWTLDGSPASGMLIFNESGSVAKGLYYWDMDKSKWVNVVNASELITLITTNTTVANTSTNNTLITTVNGVSSLGADIIKNNSLTLVDGVLTSVVNGVASSPGIRVLTSAGNGLTASQGIVELGGTLTKPTSIVISDVNTLSVKGLTAGDASTDNLLVVNSTGIVKSIPSTTLSTTNTQVLESLVTASINAQTRFETPTTISDLGKIQVYRNGINVRFAKADDTHIDLESEAACYINDQIRIIQIR